VLFSRLLKRGTHEAADGLEQASTLLSELDARSPQPPANSLIASNSSLWVTVSRSMLPGLALEQLRRGDTAAGTATVLRMAEAAGLSSAAVPTLQTLTTLVREIRVCVCRHTHTCMNTHTHAHTHTHKVKEVRVSG